ncbi:MAG: GAF domain-containing protein [Aggregatilineales bacterium]
MLILLAANFPAQQLLTDHFSRLLVFGFLTALALFFSSRLTEGSLSPAHVVGMMAFLSLPIEVYPSALWAIFLGGVGGGVLLFARDSQNPLHFPFPDRRWWKPVFLAARVTLSFAVAGEIYVRANGTLPLTTRAWTAENAILLGVYCFAYITLYFAIFLLESYNEGRSIRQMLDNDFLQILVILLLPVPFALLSAEVSTQLSTSSEVINITGVVLIIVGLYALSQSEQRLRKQLNELRTLSIVTRAMRAHLNMEALLKTVYLQVAHLLETENFTVVLNNPEENRLDFPLVIRHGQEDASTEPEDRQARYTNGLIKHVMQTGVPLLIRDNVAQKVEEMGIKPLAEYCHSWVGVPLLAGGRTLGIITAYSDKPTRHFNADDMRLLNIVASSASIAIENAQLYHQQTERVEQMATLNNIASLLSGTLSPDTVIDTIISSASTISKANAVSVYMLWDTSDMSMNMRNAGLSAGFSVNPPEPFLLSEDETQRTMPLAIKDISKDDRAEPIRNVMRLEKKQAMVELPLIIDENDFGVLVLYYDDPQIFSGERLEVLRSFATQASQAIKNARTYTTTDTAFQRSVERLLSLASAGSLLASTIDQTKIGELVLSHAIDATYADAGIVAFYDDDSDDEGLVVAAQEQYPPKIFAQEETLRAFIGTEALTTMQPYLIVEPEHTAIKMTDGQSAKSQLNVPILRDRGRVGFIILQSATSDHFDDEDAHFVAQMATQTVIAADNARLFKRITEARDRLQVILDAMDEAILLVDARGKIALANPRIKMLGLEPEKLIDKSLREVVNNDDLKSFKRFGFDSAPDALSVVDDLKSHRGWKGYTPNLYSLSTEQGTVYIQRYIIPVRDENDQVMGALMVFYNKTEEEELNNAREQLSRMIVHDLRSPLTAVTTSIKLLRELVPQESEYWQLVDTTTDASRRAIHKLLARVDSLLDISKMESGRLAIDQDVTELDNLADSVCIELSPLAKELEVTLVTEISDNVPLMNIDGDKVERLLLNLVDNALKYSPANTVVTIRAYAPGENDAPEGFVRTEVVDQGPGIPEDYKESLFESFMQVHGRKKVRRGVGLGLTFCKLVAEAHGGRIWIEDNPEGGSIFVFTLPIINATRLPEDTGEFPVIDF